MRINPISGIDSSEYPKIGAGVGVAVAIYFSMRKNYGFWKTTVYAVAFGGAGAFIGQQIHKFKK